MQAGDGRLEGEGEMPLHAMTEAVAFVPLEFFSTTAWNPRCGVQYGSCCLIRHNLAGPFLVHKLLGPRPPPPLPTDASEGKRSEAAPEAVGGGCQSGWGRLLSVTNAIEAGTCRQGAAGHRLGALEGPLPMHLCPPPPPSGSTLTRRRGSTSETRPG